MYACMSGPFFLQVYISTNIIFDLCVLIMSKIKLDLLFHFLYFISYLFLQFCILNTKWQLLHICCSLFIKSKEKIVQKNIKKMNLKINNKKGSLKKTHKHIVLNFRKNLRFFLFLLALIQNFYILRKQIVKYFHFFKNYVNFFNFILFINSSFSRILWPPFLCRMPPKSYLNTHSCKGFDFDCTFAWRQWKHGMDVWLAGGLLLLYNTHLEIIIL